MKKRNLILASVLSIGMLFATDVKAVSEVETSNISTEVTESLPSIVKVPKKTVIGLSDHYNCYHDAKLSVRGKLVKDQVYETESYFEKNGIKYYSLYRYDSEGKRSFYGYVNENALKDLTMTKVDKRTVYAVGNYKRYSNFFWKYRGISEAGTIYETSGYYTVKGTKYYSLYRYDSEGKRGWYGYVNEDALKDLTMTKVDKRTVYAVGNYKRYSNFFWKYRGIAEAGTIYETSGYYTVKGTKYYSLYRYDSEGKRGWYGYVNENALKDLTMTKVDKRTVYAVGNYKRYSNFFWKYRGIAEAGTIYETSGYYTVKGTKYYSLYRYDSEGKREWYGYVNENALKDLTMTKMDKTYVTVSKTGYKRYSNFFWKYRGMAEKDQTYETTGYYSVNGHKYYSLYRYDSEGKRGWYGYVNSDAMTKLTAYSFNKRGTFTGDYTRWNNFYWTQKKGTTSSYKGKAVKLKYYYTVKGTRYYSVYTTDDKWLGYVNAKAINVYDYIKMKNIAYYDQYAWGVPSGCEGCALLQALQTKGYVRSENPRTFLQKIPRTSSPKTGFGGDPFLGRNQPGFPAIYSQPLARWGAKFGKVYDYTGKSFSSLIDEVKKGNPVVAYVTSRMEWPQWMNTFFGPFPANNHAVTIVGYDEEKGQVYLSDSISGVYWTSYARVKQIYDTRKMAVVVK